MTKTTARPLRDSGITATEAHVKAHMWMAMGWLGSGKVAAAVCLQPSSSPDEPPVVLPLCKGRESIAI